jgi:hypothetical protein
MIIVFRILNKESQVANFTIRMLFKIPTGTNWYTKYYLVVQIGIQNTKQ